MIDNIRSEQQPIRQRQYLLPCLHFFLRVASLLFILSGALINDMGGLPGDVGEATEGLWNEL